jgi:hypothetical protein
VTYPYHYLSHIANDAYGFGSVSYIDLLNKSKYNVQHCVYRESASNCGSAKVTSPSIILSQPASWGAKAWLSLCNKDKVGLDGLGSLLGTAYQVIWVPTADRKEPGDLEPPTTSTPSVPPTPATPIDWSKLKKKAEEAIPGLLPGLTSGGGGTSTVQNSKTCSDGSTLTWASGEPEPACLEEKKAGVPWWLGAILGLGALTTVIYFAVKDKKKGKKKAAKKGRK